MSRSSALLGLLLVLLIAGWEPVKALESSRKIGRVKIPKADEEAINFPAATDKGFLEIYPEHGSKMYYNFFEAEGGANKTTPIVLWLQGGPGCSSFFGMLYINGPYFVNNDLTLSKNLGSWNRLYGLLFIEQPIGVGFSKTGSKRIPSNEVEVAYDLYRGLQLFYKQHSQFAKRPLVIVGESYAGKYVPSITHFILQADAEANGYAKKLDKRRNIGTVEPPVFELGGMAVGNGFTDAETQTLFQAEVAHSFGLIDMRQRRVAEAMQLHTIDLVLSESYAQARAASDALLAYINGVSGTATLEDVRRNLGYDGWYQVDAYLNQRAVQSFLGVAEENVTWASCAPDVDRTLRHDVMRSVKKLVADVLKFRPALFYQGQFDGECGVASNDAWLDSMQWEGHAGFRNAERRFWVVNDRIAGFWKQHKSLSHVVVRNTGHMLPHDNPLLGQMMIEKWISERIQHKSYARQTTPSAEANMIVGEDVGDRACCQPVPKPPPSELAQADEGGVNMMAKKAKGDEVMKGEVVKGEVVKGEVVKGEVVKGEVVKGDAQINEISVSSSTSSSSSSSFSLSSSAARGGEEEEKKRATGGGLRRDHGFTGESALAMERFFEAIAKAAPRDEELRRMAEREEELL